MTAVPYQIELIMDIPADPQGSRGYHYYFDKGMIESDPETGCWIWQGAQYDDGYGKVRGTGGRQGSPMRAQRYFYQLYHGPVPGLDVGHKCHRRLCVRLDHLEAITHAENLFLMFGAVSFSDSDKAACTEMMQAGADLTTIADVLLAPRPAVMKLMQELSPRWRET